MVSDLLPILLFVLADNARLRHQLAQLRQSHVRRMSASPRYGGSNGRSTLTEDMVRDIMLAVRAGVRTTAIADSFGIAPATVTNIKHGRAWAHLGLALLPGERRHLRTAWRRTNKGKAA